MDSATCIVALSHLGKTSIGGDSLAIHQTSGDKVLLSNQKVFSKTDDDGNQWLFGFTGIYRLGQVLQHVLELPRLNSEKDLLESMVKQFIPSLQKCLEETSLHQRGKLEFAGGTFLVCLKGRIFIVEKQFSVQESTLPFDAIGCGSPVALGSLFSTYEKEPLDRVTMALSAAETFSAGVQRPFTILNTDFNNCL